MTPWLCESQCPHLRMSVWKGGKVCEFPGQSVAAGVSHWLLSLSLTGEKGGLLSFLLILGGFLCAE